MNSNVFLKASDSGVKRTDFNLTVTKSIFSDEIKLVRCTFQFSLFSVPISLHWQSSDSELQQNSRHITHIILVKSKRAMPPFYA